ncbi:MAG: heme biosynthesis HemY N-terminal domain-containing protein [Pseudomonadota bacterium]|nr:heme biosynthesis HemY N-terminal domain-containing protein [Pseudomonadota bacterium]
MIRFTLYMILSLAAVVVTAVWFSERPGSVLIEWEGWLIQLSVGRFVLTAAVLLIASVFLLGLMGAVGKAPKKLREWRQSSRRERGYKALTNGMVAVAAGDPEEANRQARRANILLKEPPLTMLLSAQAAQLNGDEEAAARYFEEMLGRPETAFLGVRGLLIKAQKENNRQAALLYAERAYELQPKTAWVLNTMFDLQIAEGRWRAALATLDEADKRGAVGAASAQKRRAVVLLGCSEEADTAGDLSNALKFARRANTLAPDFLPAVLRIIDIMVRMGKARPASRFIQNAWARTPHPALASSYGEIGDGGNDALRRVKRLEKLLSFNPDHPESHIALAEAALQAKLWGEARKHLESAAGEDPSARVCRMMAELEERSGGNSENVRSWLIRASDAPPDAAWVCADCGAAWDEWTATCGSCDAFGSLAWEPPAHARALSLQVPDKEPSSLLLDDEISKGYEGEIVDADVAENSKA